MDTFYISKMFDDIYCLEKDGEYHLFTSIEEALFAAGVEQEHYQCGFYNFDKNLFNFKSESNCDSFSDVTTRVLRANR